MMSIAPENWVESETMSKQGEQKIDGHSEMEMKTRKMF
jgi:hypothetical protein